MNRISITQATKLSSPNPITLVCTETPDNNTNLAPVSFYSYLSFQPEMLGFAMMKQSYSGELIRKNKRVVLAMPGSEIADAAFSCGTVSGRDKNKAEELGILLTEIPNCPIKVPVQSRLVFDCRLTEYIEVGDHYLYICIIDAIFGDESKVQLLAWNGYANLRPL